MNHIVTVKFSETQIGMILDNIEEEIDEELEKGGKERGAISTPITAKHFSEAAFSKYLTGEIMVYDDSFWANERKKGYLFGSNCIIYGRIVDAKKDVLKMNLSIRKDKIRIPANYILAVVYDLDNVPEVSLVGWKSALELKKSKRKDKYFAMTSSSLNALLPMMWH
jgi:hypothetical protein